jgi:leucyl aminopeptidase
MEYLLLVKEKDLKFLETFDDILFYPDDIMEQREDGKVTICFETAKDRDTAFRRIELHNTDFSKYHGEKDHPKSNKRKFVLKKAEQISKKDIEEAKLIYELNKPLRQYIDEIDKLCREN